MSDLKLIVAALAKNHGVTQEKAKALVEDFLGAVENTVKEKGELAIHKFGRFHVKEHKGVKANRGFLGPVDTGPFKVVKFKAYFEAK